MANNRQDDTDYLSLYIWGGTIFVAAAIVGACVYIALHNRAQTTQQTAPPQEVARQQIVDVKPPREQAPSVDVAQSEDEAEAPIIKAAPESFPDKAAPEVDEEWPPRLQLDNLAGTLKVALPFMALRKKIPLDHTCFRKNMSPDVQWYGAPPETQSFVVFLERRDGQAEPFWGWMLFNIPGESRGVEAGQPAEPELENGARHAMSDNENIGYIGPCETKGRHSYAIRVFALDTILDAPPRTGKYGLIKAMNGHIIDAAEMEFTHYYKL